ncbi:MAG TPA: enoyl-CoA hydratase-related protein [Acidobacteriota bacterium]|nr:enoyl-CoA hydratase/isomerase family protein [Acidobacteriota bacterium]HNC43556.1 enoyl-CoA hydratase-related protein [Acidobacteriota bacterium]HNG95306.1 enoyl-CoA hydratase-related protein [Acidobacteriota bacterium]
MYENLLIEKQGAIAFLKINRPDKLNALNIPTRNEILKALEELHDDAEVRVLIVTGVGEKAFIAGADISEFAGMTAITQREVMTRRRAFDAMENFPKPVIAMINGFCLGGGCELALACDIRVASENAKLGQPEIKLGVIPGGGGTQRMARLIGEGKAMELILTGDMVDAQEALKLGLVNHVFPHAELEAKTLELAKKIADKSPVALRFAKEAVKSAAKANLREGLEREVDLFALCFASEDKEEGVKAFLEKRKPEFKGK